MSPSMTNEELAALDDAFRIACAELLLAANDEDSERRMQLSKIVVGIANGGERDPSVIAQRAVRLMKQNEPAM